MASYTSSSFSMVLIVPSADLYRLKFNSDSIIGILPPDGASTFKYNLPAYPLPCRRSFLFCSVSNIGAILYFSSFEANCPRPTPSITGFLDLPFNYLVSSSTSSLSPNPASSPITGLNTGELSLRAFSIVPLLILGFTGITDLLTTLEDTSGIIYL